MIAKVGLVRPGSKEVEVIDAEFLNSTDLYTQFIDNDVFSFVNCSKDGSFKMVLDEEGRMKGLPYNFSLELTYPEPVGKVEQRILGNALFVRIDLFNMVGDNEDYMYQDITKEDIENIKKIFL